MYHAHPDDHPDDTHTILEPRISHDELRRALTTSGMADMMSSGGDLTAEQNLMLEALHAEIEAILGKKPSLVVKTSEVHEHALHWKALQLMGDENLVEHERERPAIDVHSDKNAKAMQKMGTVKAIESKKIRDRLGSDMSSNQMHKMKVAEVSLGMLCCFPFIF